MEFHSPTFDPNTEEFGDTVPCEGEFLSEFAAILIWGIAHNIPSWQWLCSCSHAVRGSPTQQSPHQLLQDKRRRHTFVERMCQYE